MWYALKIGFSYQEALDQPVAVLKSLMAVEQIKHEGATYVKPKLKVFDSETMDITELFPPEMD